jgi:hypothetical protein
MIALCTLIHTLRGSFAARDKRNVTRAPRDLRHRAAERNIQSPPDRKTAEPSVLHIDVGNFS